MSAYLASHVLEIVVVLIALVAATFAVLDALRSRKPHITLKGGWMPSSHAQAEDRVRRVSDVVTPSGARGPHVRARLPAAASRPEET